MNTKYEDWLGITVQITVATSALRDIPSESRNGYTTKKA